MAAVLTTTLLQPALAKQTGDENWTEFRGPAGQGHSAIVDAPLRWLKPDNVVWWAEIPGEGWSSPVHAEGKVFLTTAAPAEGRDGLDLLALCVDAASGEIVWRSTVFHQGSGAPAIHRKNSHASPTPVVAGGRIYVHFGHQGTACLDFAGKVLWRNSSLNYPPVHGNGGSPVLEQDLLIFHADGGEKPFLAALRSDSGKLAWKRDRSSTAKKAFSFCTPLVIEAAGRRQLISPFSNAVSGCDPRTGQEIWRVSYEGYSVVPRPVYAQGLVFVCTGYDQASLLAIDPSGRGDVAKTHVRWRRDKRVPLTPSMLAVDEELYLVDDNGIVTCLEARTGKEHWVERLVGNYSASPVLAAGRIYIVSEEGLVSVLAPGQTFQRLAESDLEERVLASPAPVSGGFLVRTAGNLYRFGAPASGAAAGG
ncbi:MAG TPA: PQQ-binding-like beta-propeller repeat protein [Verrucomicrobiales bacterium]|nr:PQQ-binding-like beta-propeller repeat protein [Verrucomicrobiales bacterium]